MWRVTKVITPKIVFMATMYIKAIMKDIMYLILNVFFKIDLKLNACFILFVFRKWRIAIGTNKTVNRPTMKIKARVVLISENVVAPVEINCRSTVIPDR